MFDVTGCELMALPICHNLQAPLFEGGEIDRQHLKVGRLKLLTIASQPGAVGPFLLSSP